MTSKLLSKNDNNDENINKNNEIKEKKNFVDAINLQPSFLFNNVMSKNILFSSQQTQLMRESLSDEQLQTAREKHINKLINKNAETVSNIALINENIVLSTNLSRKRNKNFNLIVENDKDFIFINVNYNTHFKANK